MSSRIKNLLPRVIINSRCDKTIEVDLVSNNWDKVTSSVPSGRSKGKNEAIEINPEQAVKIINDKIFPKIKDFELCRQNEFDNLLDKFGDIGSNTKLVLSMAYLKLSSSSLSLENFAYIRHYLSGIDSAMYQFPAPLFNIVNGGMHANNNLIYQEFIIIPKIKANFKDNYWAGVKIYQNLKQVLEKSGLGTTVADEGGYSFDLKDNLKVFDLFNLACNKSSFTPGKDIYYGIDVSANNVRFSNEKMKSDYEKIVSRYPIVYLEDPYPENDLKYWFDISSKFAGKMMVVGDDLTVTNSELIDKYSKQKLINAVIIKPNQIGTISKTLKAIQIARRNKLKVIVSHRSGETNDDFIADLAIAVEADAVKFGAPARGERVAKYNRLLKIEDSIIHTQYI